MWEESFKLYIEKICEFSTLFNKEHTGQKKLIYCGHSSRESELTSVLSSRQVAKYHLTMFWLSQLILSLKNKMHGNQY